MKAVKKGKDGRLYFGKGTKGGLAPQPVSSRINVNSVNIIPGEATGFEYTAPMVGGKYSYTDLFQNGFTREEVNMIESASPTGTRKTHTAQSLLLKQAMERKYGEHYDHYSTAHTMSVAFKDAVSSLTPLPEDPADRFMKLRELSPIYGRVLTEVLKSAKDYSGRETDAKHSLYSPGLIEYAQRLEKKYNGGDYSAIETGSDGKIYVSNDSSDFIRAVLRESESNEYIARHVKEDLDFYGAAAAKYNAGESGYSSGYHHDSKRLPSTELVAARIEAAYAEKQLRAAEEKSGRGLIGALMGPRKTKAVKKAEIELNDKKNARDFLERNS